MVGWLGITVLWIFLYSYLILASIDFGAGFFSFYDRIQNKQAVSSVINRYLSPAWEGLNICFVLLFVCVIGLFPQTAFYYGTGLLVPGSFALILMALRGCLYAFYYYTSRDGKIFRTFYGVTGLLIPAVLSTVLTISEGGFISLKNNKGHLLISKLLTSFYSWAVIMLAIVSVLYISAMFLTYYANKVNERQASEKMRAAALCWSVPTILACALVFAALQVHNPEHFNQVLNHAWMFELSLVCFFIAVTLIFRKKYYGLAFFLVLLQFYFAFFGYGLSHLPFLLYPYVEFHVNFSLPFASLIWLFAAVTFLAILIPFIILWLRLYILKKNKQNRDNVM
ncbi:cytochrome d ubiquinol oxidase subunit II [Scopulibacillus daqui]|uniref:Cytochrome d ubiquinol oxidase subunit II n=1 Tax=Scopulibacillus daqui TaxID=1469162 RepID=A0ABS2Q074_9BACL|nr:cytochrome d ubiquinol oxidase subunit II [Scopulibacillus daqui]